MKQPKMASVNALMTKLIKEVRIPINTAVIRGKVKSHMEPEPRGPLAHSKAIPSR